MKIKTTLLDIYFALAKKNITILTYHSISDHPNPYALRKDVFNEQMKYIRNNDYQVISLRDAVSILKSGNFSRNKSLVLTFDDGYKDNFYNAYPVLNEFGFPATFFIVTGAIGGKNNWDGWNLELMNWDEISHLARAGHIIGCHTHTHRKLSENDDAFQLEYEINTPHRFIRERIGEDFIPFAYPYGSGSYYPHARRATSQSYNCAVKSGGYFGNNITADIWSLNRVRIDKSITMKSFKKILKGLNDNDMGYISSLFGRLCARALPPTSTADDRHYIVSHAPDSVAIRENSPRRIKQLFISPSYVPIDSSVTLINAKIIDKVEEIGVDTVVLTTATNDTLYPVTPDLLKIFKDHKKVYRVRSYEKGGRFLTAFRKTLEAIFPIIFYIPDYHFIWEWLSVLELFRNRKELDIDVIHSVSAPYCSHVVGYFAKLILKKPWVCHLDDFWVDQAFEHFHAFRFINVYIEKLCFDKADVILSTSKEILDLAEKRYPENIRNKFRYIPPCYEQAHYNQWFSKDTAKYRFTFTGKIYPGRRDPLSLFDALRIIKDKSPTIFQKLEVNLVGLGCEKYQSVAQEKGVSEIVNCQERVGYEEAIRWMKEAAVVVHLGMLDGKNDVDVYVSGKIFEYIGAERLLLSITTPTGPVANFTRDIGGMVADCGDPLEIAASIIQILNTYLPETLYNWKNPPHLKNNFSSDAVARVYKGLFESLIRLSKD